MTRAIAETELAELAAFVADRLGLNFPRDRWDDLERGVISAAPELGFPNLKSFTGWLLSSRLSRTPVEILASHLTIGETYFYRDPEVFETLENHVLPELVRERENSEKRIRIWCAGCCTGEEAYSIAIAVRRVLPDLRNWNVTILATDINPRFLRKAAIARYRDWSFRGCPEWIKERYFTAAASGFWQLQPEITQMVRFAHVNLAEDSYPSLLNNTNAMDVIFCRNVLMYFAADRSRTVIQKLHRALADRGRLFVSASEIGLLDGFAVEIVNGTPLYEKRSGLLPDAHAGTPWPRVPASSFAPFEAMPAETLTPKDWTRLTQPLVESVERKPLTPEKQTMSLAQSLFESGLYREAAAMLSQLVLARECSGGTPARAMALLARACANLGELERARDWCHKAIAAEKLDPELRYLLAMILQELELPDEAILSLKRALYLDQNFALAHISLASLLKKRGSLREAGRHGKIALSILGAYMKDEVIPLSGGMSAAKLREMVESTGETGGSK